MTHMVAQTDAEFAIALKKLLTTVVANTKNEVKGKPANIVKEEAALEDLFKTVKGRSITPEEKKRVLSY